MQRLLTIVIPFYRSEKLIISHLKRIPSKYRIIIIDNSYNKFFKKIEIITILIYLNIILNFIKYEKANKSYSNRWSWLYWK